MITFAKLVTRKVNKRFLRQQAEVEGKRPISLCYIVDLFILSIWLSTIIQFWATWGLVQGYSFSSDPDFNNMHIFLILS